MVKLFENFQTDEEINFIRYKYEIYDYIINDDKTISVNNWVSLKNNNLNKLPLRFREVTGYFNCTYNKLTTLEGSPNITGGYFNCSRNLLVSLVGGPKKVGGGYGCSYNNIINFHGFPEYMGYKYSGGFHCEENPIYAVWYLFQDINKIELLNEMDPLRNIDGVPHVIIDIFNDFLSIIGEPEVRKIDGYKTI